MDPTIDCMQTLIVYTPMTAELVICSSNIILEILEILEILKIRLETAGSDYLLP